MTTGAVSPEHIGVEDDVLPALAISSVTGRQETLPFRNRPANCTHDSHATTFTVVLLHGTLAADFQLFVIFRALRAVHEGRTKIEPSLRQQKEEECEQK